MVPRRRVPSVRDMSEKRKQPKQKQAIEVPDFAQPNGLDVSRGVAPPRPKKIVLPDVIVSERSFTGWEAEEKVERTCLHRHKSAVGIVDGTVD